MGARINWIFHFGLPPRELPPILPRSASLPREGRTAQAPNSSGCAATLSRSTNPDSPTPTSR